MLYGLIKDFKRSLPDDIRPYFHVIVGTCGKDINNNEEVVLKACSSEVYEEIKQLWFSYV